MDIIERLEADRLERMQNSSIRALSVLQQADLYLCGLMITEPQWTRDDLIKLVDFAILSVAEARTDKRVKAILQ